MQRREFIFRCLNIAAMGISLRVLTACSGSGYGSSYGTDRQGSTGGGGSGTGICPNGTNVVYVNPGHAHTTVKLSQAQVQAAVPGNYTLLGGGHSHTFNLTAADFVNLKAGKTVSNVPESDGSGHGHLINVVCV